MKKMSSEIDGQYVQVQSLLAPICINAASGINPSLPPTEGSIARDDTDPGILYVATGLQWIKAAAGGDIVGPNISSNNDLVSFDRLTGKLVKDSGILSTDVVKASSTSVGGDLVVYNGNGGRTISDSGILATNVVIGPGVAVANNLASYNGTTGKLIKDSGIIIINTSVPGVTFTNSNALDPNLTGTIYLQKITIGAISTITMVVDFHQSIAITQAGAQNWTAGTAVPSGYIPAPGTLYWPCMLQTAAAVVHAYFTMYNNGIIILYSPGGITAALTVPQLSADYNLV